MNKLLPYLLVILSLQLPAQQIMIPHNPPAQIDGKVSVGEWDNAQIVQMDPSTNLEVNVLMMHDSINLYFLFYGALSAANVRFPEVLLDVQNDKSSMWMMDDWWFHTSATDCESQGQYGNYDSCQVVRPGWLGVPNFTPSTLPVDTVEMMIPFNTIGFDLMTMDSLGISLVKTNTFNAWENWPTSSDHNNPSTWGTAYFGASSIAISEHKLRDVHFFPNPASDHIQFESEVKTVEIRDMQGRLVLEAQNTDVVYLGDLNKGLYLVRMDGIEKLLGVSGKW